MGPSSCCEAFGYSKSATVIKQSGSSLVGPPLLFNHLGWVRVRTFVRMMHVGMLCMYTYYDVTLIGTADVTSLCRRPPVLLYSVTVRRSLRCSSGSEALSGPNRFLRRPGV